VIPDEAVEAARSIFFTLWLAGVPVLIALNIVLARKDRDAKAGRKK
jgi:hypothetical protein